MGGVEIQTCEYASRDEFCQCFKSFILDLKRFGGGEVDFQNIADGLERTRLNFSKAEGRLFETAFTLFCIKHRLPPHDIIPEAADFLEDGGLADLTIEFGGAVGVGKSTVAGFLAPEIGGRKEDERFEPGGNPFLADSYQEPGLMLRTQLEFLLDNIVVGLRGKYYEGRWVRDTSVWSDIFVFMEWRRQKGIVSQEEHEVYMELVELLEPLIVKPDLLVVLEPTSVDDLWEGLQERIKDNPERTMERSISREDLEIVTGASKRMVPILQEMGAKVLVVLVNPKEVYERPDLRYSIVYDIRARLGILNEYLTKSPEKAAAEATEIFMENGEAQVVLIHSPSMFTAKTEAMVMLAQAADRANGGKVLAFQPAAALRYSGQEACIMGRDGGKIPAVMIESNRLEDIVAFVEDGIASGEISPKKQRYIFIDEGMLFLATEDAKKSIEALRKLGFNVVCDFIDYTFQEEPFTFSHDLLKETVENPDWHEIEVGTRCRYCPEEAKGTRRILMTGETASCDNQAFQSGDEEYEPVCCEEHKSCGNQPRDFVRQPLPTTVS